MKDEGLMIINKTSFRESLSFIRCLRDRQSEFHESLSFIQRLNDR